jgi:PKHD-type hydroxylase
VHVVPSVLAAEELARLCASLERASWGDGRASARGRARGVKHNEEAQRTPGADEKLVVDRLSGSEHFSTLALPRRLSTPIFSRYRTGMHYGRHLDNALLGSSPPLRSDLSVTLVLSEPESYGGGELVVETPAGEAEFKPPAGHAVVYPSTMEHWVEPVTHGERLAAVLWVESFVRDAEVREWLFDLSRALAASAARAPDAPETRLIARTHANLLRRFAET